MESTNVWCSSSWGPVSQMFLIGASMMKDFQDDLQKLLRNRLWQASRTYTTIRSDTEVRRILSLYRKHPTKIPQIYIHVTWLSSFHP